MASEKELPGRLECKEGVRNYGEDSGERLTGRKLPAGWKVMECTENFSEELPAGWKIMEYGEGF